MLVRNIMDFKEADTVAHMLASEADGTKLLIVGLHVVPPGGEVGQHSHPDQELAYIILNGEALVTVGDEQRKVGKYDVVWIPIKTNHGAKNIGSGELRYVFAGWAV
jgi:quercetin dioxygenase-like cupin family protein